MQPPEEGQEPPPTDPNPVWATFGSTPDPPPKKKKHWVRWAIAGGSAIVVGAAIGTATGNANKGNPAPSSTPTVTSPVTTTQQAVSTPTETPTPEVTTTRVVKQIVFKVWGSGQPDITYGNDSDNRDGGGHLGLLGSGNSLPWSRTLSFSENALYWFVTAQLNGYGSIKCAVVAKVTDYYSDGTHLSQQQNVATAHASGGYNICQAESS